jgi:hypothetical protein
MALLQPFVNHFPSSGLFRAVPAPFFTERSVPEFSRQGEPRFAFCLLLYSESGKFQHQKPVLNYTGKYPIIREEYKSRKYARS